MAFSGQTLPEQKSAVASDETRVINSSSGVQDPQFPGNSLTWFKFAIIIARKRSCKKVMFSRAFACSHGGCPHVTVTRDALDLTISPQDMRPGSRLGQADGAYPRSTGILSFSLTMKIVYLPFLDIRCYTTDDFPANTQTCRHNTCPQPLHTYCKPLTITNIL